MNQKELSVENSQNNNEVCQIENVDSKASERQLTLKQKPI